MTRPSPLLSALADSFLSGELSVDAAAARAARTLGRPWRWLQPLAQRYVEVFSGLPRPRRRDVIRFLRQEPDFQHAVTRYQAQLSVSRWLTEPQQMQPVAAAKDWEVPAIESVGGLADWFQLTSPESAWFADLKGLGFRADRAALHHYHYRVLAKRYGNLRLVEAPKPRMKGLQRQILTRILERVPIHPAAHGFVKGRSVRTFVASHVGKQVVLRMDLRDFFPSIHRARIQAFFRTAGYPEKVADILGGICTNAAPDHVWKEPGLDVFVDPQRLRDAKTLYSRPHLPQGAPSSPALANICAYRVDCRLAGLAEVAGVEYTRYADDLAFSGSEAFEKCVDRFSTHAAAILHEEGFAVHHRKTRIMRRGVRQYLAGLVTNQCANVVRTDFDRLKATLHNCRRWGPESQNTEGHPSFRSHLEGRVGFVEMINPAKGKRLRTILDEIQWVS